MRESLVGIALLLCTGCVQVPQWDTIERQTAEAELDNATTQLEMNGAAGGLAALAEEQVAAALDNKLSTLSKPERIKLLIDQGEWQRLMDRRNTETMGDGSIASMMQSQREESRLKNRFLELTAPEEVRQAFIAMRNAPVHFQEKSISLRHGELDFRIPEDKWRDGMLKTETIAQLNIPFCRKMMIGKDTFLIGVIEPTNYGKQFIHLEKWDEYCQLPPRQKNHHPRIFDQWRNGKSVFSGQRWKTPAKEIRLPNHQ